MDQHSTTAFFLPLFRLKQLVIVMLRLRKWYLFLQKLRLIQQHSGLPDPNPDHALVMARFARACIDKIPEVTKSLEVTLGPDTGDLTIRVGLHSGEYQAVLYWAN